MDQAELTLLVNMRYEELGIQQGSCATQKAQLNQQEKVLLAERDKAVKALQENPSDDTRKAKQKCDEDVVAHDKVVLTMTTKLALIEALRTSKAPGRGGGGGVGGAGGGVGGAGGGPAPIPTPSSSVPPFPNRRMMGRLPEFLTSSDYDVFLSKFLTYCSLNEITDSQQQKLLLDSALSDEQKLRAGELTALQEPYKSDDFNTYSGRLRSRFIPVAQSQIYRNQYDGIVQKANQSVTDYCASKYTAFRKSYQSYPFQFYVRTATAHLHNEDLKSEVLRSLGDLEGSAETNPVLQQKLYSDYLEIVNLGLDLCRRTSSATPDNQDRNGLRVDGKEAEPAKPTSVISQAQEEHISLLGYENQDEEGEEGYYENQEEEEGEELPLEPDEIAYCYLLESDQQSAVWERESTAEELLQMQQSPTGKKCHECGSTFHLVRSCPIRMKLVQAKVATYLPYNRTSFQSPRRGGRGGASSGWRGGRGGTSSGWRGRTSGGRRSPWRGAGGRGGYAGPRPAFPQSFQNPYTPGQPPARFGPSPGQQAFRY